MAHRAVSDQRDPFLLERGKYQLSSDPARKDKQFMGIHDFRQEVILLNVQPVLARTLTRHAKSCQFVQTKNVIDFDPEPVLYPFLYTFCPGPAAAHCRL